MPKRKRSSPAAPGSPEDPARSQFRRQKKLNARLAAATKPLVAALRHAATLERQKHSRRKKTAQASNDAKALARLEAEYAHLKALQLDKVAEQHLRKTISKVKVLRESGCLPESMLAVEKAGSQDVALLNVKGRLFKVEAVRKVVDEVIEDLKEIVGTGGKGEGQKKAKTLEDEGAEEEVEDSDALKVLDTLVAAPSSAEEDSEASLSDGHRPPSIEDSSESDDSDPDEDDLLEDPSSHDDETAPAFHSSSDESSDDASSDDTSLTPREKAKPTRKSKRAPSPPPTDSKFLPSLSHAIYISGSDSEASDVETAPRKNRRGQRARQKIWEQKYKDKAKHLQKQDRNKGWDPKRGAVEDGGRGRARGGGRGPEKSGANEQPLGPKRIKRDDAGPLHPSWQAAKAAKEKKMAVKPMGKKVVFD